VPGPGTYYNQKNHNIDRDSFKYSLRPKTSQGSSIQDFTKGYPGPGTYNISIATGLSRSNIKFKSSGVPVFNKNGSRFDISYLKSSMENPGPGNINRTLI